MLAPRRPLLLSAFLDHLLRRRRRNEPEKNNHKK